MERILELLRENSRLTNKEIATRLGLAEADVAFRVAELEKSGTVLGYHAVIDQEKIGKRGVTAFIEVKVTPESGGGFDRFARRISQYEQVRSCYLMSGGYDLVVVVEGADLYDVARFVAEKLSTLDVVLSTATHFQLRTYKHDGFLLNTPSTEGPLPVSP
ncbi:Lrp/AsnC family transcriptional regulator [Roseimicrobium sp. ORNL1]|uniref:Lrp/AsnC family transcriptional regulator n=1 Tax=Roseimicrobium sp. ORNL1 TaxID=2711231 RepID=UPI0013E169C0|nr:Lrp/AsnC family transcriptional regulator [Roseimicrobium sp. ORNL1]QIF04058.1 Lrp/AsnC family transcriptional regulator [Roseimicrobium sp. ORNL1]